MNSQNKKLTLKAEKKNSNLKDQKYTSFIYYNHASIISNWWLLVSENSWVDPQSAPLALMVKGTGVNNEFYFPFLNQGR